jgi:hypothetical protein
LRARARVRVRVLTPAAIWVPAAMNLPTTPLSSVCTTTTPGDCAASEEVRE